MLLNHDFKRTTLQHGKSLAVGFDVVDKTIGRAVVGAHRIFASKLRLDHFG